MDHHEAGRYWESNAETWTRLARAGFDICRDGFNTPAFLAVLPPIAHLNGLDIGCGEGHNTRLLARRGARMTAVDIAPTFIAHASEAEAAEPLGIRYLIASAAELPFRAESFDFATSFMCLMDVPETDRVLAEAFRVLKPGGFLQFSITHPCFDTPRRRNLRGPDGRTYAIEVGGYFRRTNGDVSEWLFSAAPPEAKAGARPFRVPVFHRTLSEWVNAVLEAGFQLEHMAEPTPDDATLSEYPGLQDTQVVAYFLHIRARKPR